MADEPKSETVTIEVPARVLKDLRSLVDAGIYLSVEEALRESILASWRFMRGSYANIRLDTKAADADGDEEAPADA